MANTSDLFPNDPAERIVRESERRRITGVGRTAWWEAERRGDAPARVVLLGGRVGWRLSELLDWIRARPRARVEAEVAEPV